jgi:hypothetical protein
MKTGTHLAGMLVSTMWIALLVGYATCAVADTPDGKLQRDARFQEDRRICLSANSRQSPESCLREARAVRADPPSSTVEVSKEELQKNAERRCDAFTSADRADCLARIRGEGTVSGSVEGGGIYRERVTTEVPAPQAPSPLTRKP